MRLTCVAAFAACLAHVQIVAGQKCSSNNCLRAIKKITKGRNATADCLSFFEVTVTPSPRTSTTTVTVRSSVQTLTQSRNSTSSALGKNASTTTSSAKSHELRGVEYEPLFDSVGKIQALEDRQLTGSATSTSIPKYATPCSSLAAYKSACSCIRVSRVTTTVTPQTTTKTVTSVKTIANATVIANQTSSLGNSTAGHGWNATSSRPLWQSDSTATLSSEVESSASFTSHSSGLAASSASNTVVHVLNTTTLITVTTPSWTNSSSSIGSTAPFLNSSTVSATLTTDITSFSKLNLSTAASSLRNSTTPRWQNTSTPVTLLANSTKPVWLNTSVPTPSANIRTGRWLNTSVPTPFANITTGRWLNTTTPSPVPTNITSFRWLNSTMLPNATTARWLNTSSSIPTPTPTLDTTCGETAAPFALQVSQSEGMYDGWYVHVSGNGLLFTSVQSSASSFSIEASGHLCAIGRLDRDDLPRIAAVGIRDPISDVWLVEPRTLELLDEDYAAVKCTRDGSLSCAANATNPASHWVGCGLQLDLYLDGGGMVPVRGLNCSSLALNIVGVTR